MAFKPFAIALIAVGAVMMVFGFVAPAQAGLWVLWGGVGVFAYGLLFMLLHTFWGRPREQSRERYERGHH